MLLKETFINNKKMLHLKTSCFDFTD